MTGTIHLKYIKGIIPKDSLELLQSRLGDHGIEFEWHDISGAPQAGVHELLAPIVLYLSSDVVQAYLLGLATSASYDLIKSSVLDIWRHISGKKFNKITSTGIEEMDANFDLDVNTSGKTRVKFKLKGNISDSLKEKCIDKAFHLVESKSFPEIHRVYVCRYDVDSEQWEILEQLEFIRKYVIPKKG
jgi:hypothetical protein